MANKDRPSGFAPRGEPRRTETYTAGSRVFPGDAVALASDGKIDPAAAGVDILGVALTYADAEDDKCNVSTDPEQIYTCQADGADITAVTSVGNNADILATAGNTTYKTSRMEIDSSTASAAAAQCTIVGVGIEPRPDNAGGANVTLMVKFNENQAYGETDFAGI